MIEIDVPGFHRLRLEHLVLDFNGTLARDGRLLDGIGERLHTLAQRVDVHVLTADTFGKARDELGEIPCQIAILGDVDQDSGKLEYVHRLGSQSVVCIGNGRNDRLMLQEAALGVAVMLPEGAAAEAVRSADVVCTNILSALDLLIHPLRLVATLRC